MDLIANLGRLRDYSYDMTANQGTGAPGHGKPEDYGLRGAKPNYPLNSAPGMRMAGHGIAGAIVGEIAPHVVEPLRAVIQPAFNHVISETFGTGIPTPQIARR